MFINYAGIKTLPGIIRTPFFTTAGKTSFNIVVLGEERWSSVVVYVSGWYEMGGCGVKECMWSMNVGS